MTDKIFVDTFYLVARLNPQYQWHRTALAVESERGVGTDESDLVRHPPTTGGAA